ncbi:MAG: GDP-L-fucose synthase [Woeseiaceae bacterium]
MNKDSTIYVAGSTGMVGSAIVRALVERGYEHVLTTDRDELDLLDSRAVKTWFDAARPEYVIDAAARVGGINANNSQPVEFLLDNLRIQDNVIQYAFEAGAKKLLFLGSSCIYPKHAEQPMKEDALLTGPLEPTNEAYAIAKIAGIKLCAAYRRQYGKDCLSAMPTNLYGPHDNFDLDSSHVLPALLRKFHEAKESGAAAVSVWGSGKPLREFLHVNDLANACIHLLQTEVDYDLVNVGSGEEISIADLARLIADVVGFDGNIEFDASMPDGTPRKLMDSGRMKELGWQPQITLDEGIRSTYDWALVNDFSSR